MSEVKLLKVEEAEKILEEGLRDFKWKIKELPLHQCLGMYLGEDLLSPQHSDNPDADSSEADNPEADNPEASGLKKGQRIGPREVSLLASLGNIVVGVFEKPLVSIISLGDELVSVIEEPAPGKVRDSNSFALAALTQETGCDVGGVYLLGSDKNILKETLEEALDRSDLVILSGGTDPNPQRENGITGQAIQGLGSPGILVNGLDLKEAENVVVGIIEDTHCACCNRKSLIVGLPSDPKGVFAAYDSLIDGLIKKVFFSYA